MRRRITETRRDLTAKEEDPEQEEDTFSEDAIDSFLHIHSFLKYDHLAIRAKTTTSTEIAARTAPRASMDHIPAQFKKYSKVFSEEASQRLPQHQPWDHAIDLKPGFAMKNCSIYRLTPKESDTLKEYITEHL